MSLIWFPYIKQVNTLFFFLIQLFLSVSKGHFIYLMMFLPSWPIIPTQRPKLGLPEKFFPNLTSISYRCIYVFKCLYILFSAPNCTVLKYIGICSQAPYAGLKRKISYYLSQGIPINWSSLRRD